MWSTLAMLVVFAGDIYVSEGEDGVLRFTDSPTHTGFVRIDGDAPVPEVRHVNTRTFPRLNDWDEAISSAADRYQLSPALLKAVILAESGMNPQALSEVGAMGLMQLMPGTAEALGVEDAWDPYQNIDGGSRYIKQQLETFGDVRRALAAYHAGPANVRKYGGIPPFATTQAYVKRVTALYAHFQDQAPISRMTLSIAPTRRDTPEIEASAPTTLGLGEAMP